MKDIDYNKIEKIVRKVGNEISTAKVEKICKEVSKEVMIDVLQIYGLHDPEDSQIMFTHVKDDMKSRQDMKTGFMSGLGGHIATVVTTTLLVWFAAAKGWLS